MQEETKKCLKTMLYRGKMVLIPVCAVSLLMGVYRVSYALLTESKFAEQTEVSRPALEASAEAEGVAVSGDNVNEVDVLLLAGYLTAAAETHNAGIGELEAIGHVMRNRVVSGSYPDTLFDVIVQDAAERFDSGTLPGGMLPGRTQPTEIAQTAARNAFLGGDTTGGALSWGAKNDGTTWRMTIGGIGLS